jgi:uncharacterized membrane protein YjgN (DUF898 family)
MNLDPKEESPPPFSYTFNYSGIGKELAFIMFKNIFLTIITLGVYAAWGRTNTRRYLWGHTNFLNDRANYTGTGKEIFLGILKFFGIYVLTYGATMLLGEFLHPAMIFALIPVYIYLLAQIIYSGLRYRLARTTWRGVHFGMDKNPVQTREFLVLLTKYSFITLFTLGLGFPLMVHKMRLFLTSKMRFGNTHFEYTGTCSGLYKIYAKAFFLTPLTMGLYFSWFKVESIRYRLENTRFQNAHFRTSLSGVEFFGFAVGSYILTVMTLGIATPWVINMAHKLIINSIDLYGNINLEEVDNLGGQTGDSAADAGAVEYDIDIAV